MMPVKRTQSPRPKGVSSQRLQRSDAHGTLLVVKWPTPRSLAKALTPAASQPTVGNANPSSPELAPWTRYARLREGRCEANRTSSMGATLRRNCDRIEIVEQAVPSTLIVSQQSHSSRALRETMPSIRSRFHLVALLIGPHQACHLGAAQSGHLRQILPHQA